MASTIKVDQIQSDSGNVNLTGNVTTSSSSVVDFGSGQFFKATNGNIGIGINAPTGQLHQFLASGTTFRIIQNGSVVTTEYASTDVSTAAYGTATNHPLILTTNNTERIRISADGQQSSTIVGYSGTYNEYKCRAWVNFDGTTSPGTIRASGNVSSVARNGTGDYTVNFTTAMPDVNYSVGGSAAAQGSRGASLNRPEDATQTTTACQVYTCGFAGSNNDLRNAPIVSVHIFR
jgi:hypothetical protein